METVFSQMQRSFFEIIYEGQSVRLNITQPLKFLTIDLEKNPFHTFVDWSAPYLLVYVPP